MFYKSLPRRNISSLGKTFRRLRKRMLRLVRRNLVFVLQRESDVVQSIQEAVTDERIDLEARQKTLLIANLALLQIKGEMISVNPPRPPHQFSDVALAQYHGQEAVLATIVC